MSRLYKTLFYIVNLDTRAVALDREYKTFTAAIDGESTRGRMPRFTALTGARIMAHLGKPWILPATLEEAEELRDLTTIEEE